MKKFLLTLATFIALTIVTSITASANSIENLPAVNEIIENLEDSGTADSQKTLKQIANLSADELIELESILSDSDRLYEELNNPDNIVIEDISVDYELNNGSGSNNFVKYKDGFAELNATSKDYTYTATATKEVKLSLLGVNLLNYEVVGKFVVNSSKTKVLSATSMTGYATRIWVPGVSSILLSTDKKLTSDNKFKGECVFSYDLGINAIGTTRITVWKVGFTANATKIETYWAYSM